MSDEQRPGTLYRLFDAEGNLLYIGASIHVATRMGFHKREKPWWPEVARATFEHYESRHLATVAEADAIRSEEPRYNKAGPHIHMDDDRKLPNPITKDELEERRRRHTMYAVPGLHCTNCEWTGGWIRKGVALADAPCPGCNLKTLSRPAGQRRVA